MKLIKPEKMSLKHHATLDEKWLQKQIADDPSILGLGDLILKDRERILPGAGRLDLLLQDADTDRRYEVEIQLGRTDESHIIRTIEYWDLEKKRYPQYDHCAVIIAEDVTSRFHNVVSLFNGFIPLIAIQLTALKINDDVALSFTTVLDELQLGRDGDDEFAEVTDRPYWEKRASKDTVSLADELLGLIRDFAPQHQLKYNKFYISLAENGQPNNFIVFKPKKKNIRLECRLPHSDQIDSDLEESGLDLMEYDKKRGKYRIRLNKNDIETKKDTLIELMRKAHGYQNR